MKNELTAITGNALYRSFLQERIPFFIPAGAKKLPAPLVAQVLTNEIRAVVVSEILSKHPYALTDSEKADARLDAVARAGNPQTFAKFPRWYQTELVGRSTAMFRLRRALAPETADQYYKETKAVYTRACEWDIVTMTRDRAAAARARIESGESFESVAKDVSADKGSGPRGGSLGCNERDNLLPELDEAAFSQPIGAVSRPIAVGEGADQVFHLIRVTSRSTPPLTRIRGEIEAALVKLGTARLESEVRAHLVATDVRVSHDFGTWDESSLIVLPPTVAPTVSATPRPRPLPKAATSPSQVDPSFQEGQQVFITDAGVRPLLLTAIIDAKITWINDSRRPATVRFIALDHQLGPIPPGGSASYTPDGAGSIAYELVENPRVRGVVQVQWYFEPGEDPGAPNRLGADTPPPSSPNQNSPNQK